MKLQRLSSGYYKALCDKCPYGVIARREQVFEWAIGHQAKHQRARAQ